MLFSATIGFNIATCATILAPDIPDIYHPILYPTNTVVGNSMACRVYRAVKLGFIRNPQSTSRFGSTIQSRRAPGEWNHELVFKAPTPEGSSNTHIISDINLKTQDDGARGK